MPLALPRSDGRSFDALVAEGRSRIPALAPGWTDHNLHDPGITVLDLLAWLTETDLFRAGRITEAMRRTFLRWFGIEGTGPSLAETVLAVEPAPGSPAVSVPQGSAIATGDGATVFTTSAPVTAQPARLVALRSGGEGGVLRDLLPARSRGDAFLPFGASASAGDALYLGFDAPLEGQLQLYAWTGAPDHDASLRARLAAEQAARSGELPAGAPPPPDWRLHYGVSLAWEFSTGGGWTPAAVALDETRALTLSGLLRLGVPPGHARTGPLPGLWFVRARVARGRYDRPPRLKELLPNAVPARHQTAPFRVDAGTSDARAGQVFPVGGLAGVPAPGAPLVVEETRLALVLPDGTEEPWTVALDLDRAGPADAVALVDPLGAEVRFGDGRAGRIPPAGAIVRVTSRVGGGASGNLPAGSLTRWAGAALAALVRQPLAAHGGGPAPAPGDLQALLIARLGHPTRAATASDLETLALETPAVPVARVLVLPRYHPALPGLPAEGCTTAVVVPDDDLRPRPEPTPALLAAVCRWLSPRRPIATELHVVGPTWRRVAVRATLHLVPGADPAAAIAAALSALDAFLSPLNGGGDGLGWPPGRAVYRAEILALLQGVPGVDHVTGLVLLAGDPPRPLCGDAPLCPTDLVTPGAHELSTVKARTR